MNENKTKQMYVVLPIKVHKILTKIQAKRFIETGKKKSLPNTICDIIIEYGEYTKIDDKEDA